MWPNRDGEDSSSDKFIAPIFFISSGNTKPRGAQEFAMAHMELCTDEDSDDYLCHRRERQTKTRVAGDPKDVRKFKLKVWNDKDKKDALWRPISV